MTRSLLVASLVASSLALMVMAAAPQAHAFSVDQQTGNNSNGTPRFVDPDENAEKMADPSRSGSFRIQGGAIPDGSGMVGFGPGAVFAVPSIPDAARLGAGEHGFDTRDR